MSTAISATAGSCAWRTISYSKSRCSNYSGDFPFLWDEVVIPVRYGSDWALARKAFTEILRELTLDTVQASKETRKAMTKTYMIEDSRLEPMVTLVTNDNWIEFTLRYVVDYKRRRTTKDEICARILEAVEASEGRSCLRQRRSS